MSRRIASILLFAGCSLGAAGADLRIAGSDLVKSALEPVAGAAGLPGGAILCRFEGSRGGLEALRRGQADVAILVAPPGQALPEMEFRLVPLAYQVAVFAVNGTNPARQMTFGQLAGIFGENEPTRHRQWGTLALPGVWAEKPITPCTAEPRDSLALELFKNGALQVPQLRSTLAVLPNGEDLLKRVQIDDTTIGLFPGPLAETRGVHVLLVARTERDVPFGPTAENVHNGDYPLRLPFYLAFKAERTAELAPVLGVLLGEPAAVALEKAGFVAVPENARVAERRALGLR